MPLLFAIWFLIAILPIVLVFEGISMFRKHMNKYNLWWRVPYFLLIILVFILAVLLLKGYR